MPGSEPLAGPAPARRAVRILGIDPGSQVTGYGVIDVEGGRVRHVAHGCIRTLAGQSMPERLCRIFEGVSAVVLEHGPDEVVVEKVFVDRNVETALKLGQARGAALVAAARSALPVFEFTPAEVKQAVVGGGRAEKSQVQHMVCVLLALPKAPSRDAADALGVALCRAHTRRTLAQMARAVVRAGGLAP